LLDNLISRWIEKKGEFYYLCNIYFLYRYYFRW
jgi:hypothetical protein